MIHRSYFRMALTREHRLLAMSAGASERHDLVERAETTAGDLQQSPEDQLDLATQGFIARIEEKRVGWVNWLLKGGDSTAAQAALIDKEIRARAEQILAAETDLACGKIRGLFFMGRRQLHLMARQRIETRLREDLLAHLDGAERESVQREQRLQTAVDLLRGKRVPVVSHERSRQGKLRQAILKGKSTLAPGEIPTAWQKALEAEQALKQTLLSRNIVAPEQIEMLLEANARGDRSLERLVKQALQGDTKMQWLCLDTLRQLRTRNARNYRTLLQFHRDPNIGALEQRVKALCEDPLVIGRRVRLVLASGTEVGATIIHQRKGLVLLRRADSDGYIAISSDGNLSYRMPDGSLRDASLSATTFTLLP